MELGSGHSLESGEGTWWSETMCGPNRISQLGAKLDNFLPAVMPKRTRRLFKKMTMLQLHTVFSRTYPSQSAKHTNVMLSCSLCVAGWAGRRTK